jgi:hypothetical protein
MAKAIYDQIDAVLSPGLPPNPPPEIRQAWRKLSFAIATGVTTYLRRDPGDVEFAEITSSSSDDAVYWAWLGGFVQQFQSWAPATADGLALKNALAGFLTGHPVPTQMRGSLR